MSLLNYERRVRLRCTSNIQHPIPNWAIINLSVREFDIMDTEALDTYLVDYFSDLIGNIRTHLAGLQGFDVRALELIQNADDAEAEEVLFDIRDDGLIVRNDGRFTFCGDLRPKTCSRTASEGNMCDFHRIKLVGSGGKRARSSNIGRFGIGFVSVYQVTDHPSVRSSGVELVLMPEKQQCRVTKAPREEGTEFFLPWARDSGSVGRRELGVSHIAPRHISQLENDVTQVLRKSLLFLRHVNRAEIRRNGKLIFGCQLERADGDDLLVSFSPNGEMEHWIILRADAAEGISDLLVKHPHLANDKRNTAVSVGMRTEPGPLADGMLYAYLPTEQSSGLPVHINADFYPEGDRKALIFSGHQHEQAWNEALIEAAAARIANAPEKLLKSLGDVHFWDLVDSAYRLATQDKSNPACFKRHWHYIKQELGTAKVVLAEGGTYQSPVDVLISQKVPLDKEQSSALYQIGGQTPTAILRPFQNPMNQLGAAFLTLDRFLGLYESSSSGAVPGETLVSRDRILSLYTPLWSILEGLLPEGSGANKVVSTALRRLLETPLLVTEDSILVTPAQTRAAPTDSDAGRFARLFPRLAVAHHSLASFPRLRALLKEINLPIVVEHICNVASEEGLREAVRVGRSDLQDLYELLVELDQRTDADESTYQALRSLPIWPTPSGLTSAETALLPGDFKDPTGDSSLLDVTRLSVPVREFLRNKLRVPVQTVNTFVRTVLPRFFSEGSPRDTKRYGSLLMELANHPSLMDDDECRGVLQSLCLVPTRNGGWSRPVDTYWHTDALARALGDNKALWLDESRLPNSRSVTAFINQLGIRRKPAPSHLVERIISIAKRHKPTDEAKRASEQAFYALCDDYEAGPGQERFATALITLKSGAYLPADGDIDNWHWPSNLYAPYRAEAFRSQADILAFRNTNRLKTDLLNEMGISIRPETELVVNHLLWCVETGTQPSNSVYQILNERAREDGVDLHSLRDTPCIYFEQTSSFLRPNQLYWSPQRLGRYAYAIPSALASYRPLFDALGVKNAPECEDLINVLADIVSAHYDQGLPVIGTDRAVYERCLAGFAKLADEGGSLEEVLTRLREMPVVINIHGNLAFADEVLIKDSSWHAKFFSEDLDQALCEPDAEFRELLIAIGVQELSKIAQVDLIETAGHEESVDDFLAPLREKCDVIVRILHEFSAPVRSRVRTALQNLKASSCETMRVRAFVRLANGVIQGAPAETRAFFCANSSTLTIARPIDGSCWDPVLATTLHQLIREERASEIPNLVLLVALLLPLSVEEAHARATSAGIPLESDLGGAGHDQLLESEEVRELGIAEPTLETTASAADVPDGHLESIDSADGGQIPEAVAAEDTVSQENAGGEGADGNRVGDVATADGLDPAGISQKVNASAHPRKRQKYKQKWERRLLSYVKNSSENSDEAAPSNARRSHNLAVEARARRAVCEYEEARGRDPVEMAITHPGYDILSVAPGTGEERYIEVKGVTGEWNITGVGLSAYQFEMSRELRHRYWLYVVELFDDGSEPNVHPIEDPANKVTAFMFDGNWRDVSTREGEDRFARFVPGCRILHRTIGVGVILSVDVRGSSRLLTVKFDDKPHPTPNVPLNLTQIRALGLDEEQDEDLDDIDGEDRT